MSNAITLYVFEEGPVFRAQCDYPVVHAAGTTEEEAIERAAELIRQMLKEANTAILHEAPSTLIVRTQHGHHSAVRMQPLFPPGEPPFPETLA